MSPTRTALVCSGHQLEITCTATGTLLRWRFALVHENGTNPTELEQTLQYIGSGDSQLFNRTFNSSMFFIEKTSSAGVLPVISRFLITPVTDALNETVIHCEDVETGMSSNVTISVISRNLLQKFQGTLLTMSVKFLCIKLLCRIKLLYVYS